MREIQSTYMEKKKKQFIRADFRQSYTQTSNNTAISPLLSVSLCVGLTKTAKDRLSPQDDKVSHPLLSFHLQEHRSKSSSLSESTGKSQSRALTGTAWVHCHIWTNHSSWVDGAPSSHPNRSCAGPCVRRGSRLSIKDVGKERKCAGLQKYYQKPGIINCAVATLQFITCTNCPSLSLDQIFGLGSLQHSMRQKNCPQTQNSGLSACFPLYNCSL